MQTLRNLYNQALTTIGAEGSVTDPTAPSRATDVLNLWFPVARQAVFSAAHWSSLRKMERLAVAQERDTSLLWQNTDPEQGYVFAYALPNDMLQPQYLSNFTKFKLGRLGAERVLYSNSLDPILHYTLDDPEPGHWETDVYRCVIWALAACINTARSGKVAVTQKLEEQVQGLIDQASVNSANSDDTYFDSPPSFYNGTGFSLPDVSTRFYYPTSSFSSIGLISA